MRAPNWGISAVVLLLLAITGCATTQAPPDANLSLNDAEQQRQWQQHQAALKRIYSWQIRGKIGVKTGPKGGSATLKWRYQDGDQEIELYGPFGGGRVIITVDQNGAVLRDTKGRIIEGETASEVLYARLGWQVPFDQLVSWARGLPSDSEVEIMLNEQGRVNKLVQDGWQVDYQTYRQLNTPEAPVLPTKLTISAVPGTIEIYSDKGEYLGDDLSVKVILKSWSEIEYR